MGLHCKNVLKLEDSAKDLLSLTLVQHNGNDL